MRGGLLWHFKHKSASRRIKHPFTARPALLAAYYVVFALAARVSHTVISRIADDDAALPGSAVEHMEIRG